MIAGDQAEQSGFSRPVWADDLPVFTGVNLPTELVEDGAIVVAHYAITQNDQWPIVRQPDDLGGIFGFWQRQAVEIFTVSQLGDQRVGHHLLPWPLAGEGAIGQHADLLNETWDFIKPVEHQDHGITLL
ncbi:hypothetical protein D3C81_1866810 [compost metagenome]